MAVAEVAGRLGLSEPVLLFLSGSSTNFDIGALLDALPPADRPMSGAICTIASDMIMIVEKREFPLAEAAAMHVGKAAGYEPDTLRGYLLRVVAMARMGLPFFAAMERVKHDEAQQQRKPALLSSVDSTSLERTVLSAIAIAQCRSVPLRNAARRIARWPEEISMDLFNSCYALLAARHLKESDRAIPSVSRRRLMGYQWRFRLFVDGFLRFGPNRPSEQVIDMLYDAQAKAGIETRELIDRAAGMP
jgi:hypothetical protein